MHCYTSPHLVKFHERIRLGRQGGASSSTRSELAALLEECEQANGGAPITFFEITTAAAFLAFSRYAGRLSLLEVGLGGRLDATNVIARPRLSASSRRSTMTISNISATRSPTIAREKAGILKRGVAGIIGPQPDEARAEIERVRPRLGAPLLIANQDWQAYEQHGRLVYQDEKRLLDLPLPQLPAAIRSTMPATPIAAMRLHR